MLETCPDYDDGANSSCQQEYKKLRKALIDAHPHFGGDSHEGAAQLSLMFRNKFNNARKHKAKGVSLLVRILWLQWAAMTCCYLRHLPILPHRTTPNPAMIHVQAPPTRTCPTCSLGNSVNNMPGKCLQLMAILWSAII